MKNSDKLKYNEKLAEEICEEISSTPKMLENICKENDSFPTAKQVYKWRNKYKEFDEMFCRAKRSQVEPLISRAMELAQDDSKDFYDDGNKRVINYGHLQRMRMEIDTIKWLATKLLPRLYGDNKVIKDNVEEEEQLSKQIEKECYNEF